jgi:hypothetical protein
MRLLADENVDRPIIERLRRDGHDVIYVGELEPGKCGDTSRILGYHFFPPSTILDMNIGERGST